jgi:hypothetical protein
MACSTLDVRVTLDARVAISVNSHRTVSPVGFGRRGGDQIDDRDAVDGDGIVHRHMFGGGIKHDSSVYGWTR